MDGPSCSPAQFINRTADVPADQSLPTYRCTGSLDHWQLLLIYLRLIVGSAVLSPTPTQPPLSSSSSAPVAAAKIDRNISSLVVAVSPSPAGLRIHNTSRLWGQIVRPVFFTVSLLLLLPPLRLPSTRRTSPFQRYQRHFCGLRAIALLLSEYSAVCRRNVSFGRRLLVVMERKLNSHRILSMTGRLLQIAAAESVTVQRWRGADSTQNGFTHRATAR